MRTAFITLVGCAACGFPEQGGVPGDAGATSWPAGATLRQPIEIDLPLAGEVLEPARVAVRVVLAAELAASPVLGFTVGTPAAPVAVEVVDRQGPVLEAWLRLPRLDGPIVVYVSDVAVPTSSPWDESDVGVWHLSMPSAAGVVGAADSTDRHSLQSLPNAEPLPIGAVLGGGLAYDDGEFLQNAVVPAPDLRSFAYGLWVRDTAISNDYDAPLYHGGGARAEPGYCFLTAAGNRGGVWEAKVHDGDRFARAELGAGEDLLGDWHELVAVVDRDADELRAYLDGERTDTVDLRDETSDENPLGALVPVTPLWIGRQSYFAGALDEAWVRLGVPSDLELAVRHANLAFMDRHVVPGALERR